MSESKPIKVVLVCTSKFEFFDLARQLHKRDMLAAIFTGYPSWKLKSEGIPKQLIHTFPWVQVLYMARMRTASKRKKSKFDANLGLLTNRALDAYTSVRIPKCDIVMAISNTGLSTGRVVQRRGGIYICHRPCSHIRYQDRLLREEYSRFGIEFPGIDERVVKREEQEYSEADFITVPSTFAVRSFQEMDVPQHKVKHISLGVDLSRFHPTAQPDAGSFDVLFAGSVTLRKGIPYLLEAFEKVNHPRKRLLIVGTPSPEIVSILEEAKHRLPIECLGHLARPELSNLMSRCSVLVLPTIEDGFGMVMAEAMACGCPVISTTNSGATDLYEDRKEGFIVPIRDSAALADRLQLLADSPSIRQQMSERSLQRVQELGGWDTYGSNMVSLFQQLMTKEQVR